MKRILQILMAVLCLLLVAQQAQAQIDVRVEPVRRELVLGEHVVVKLIISNHTDSSVSLRNGADHNWLVFQVYASGSESAMSPVARAKFPPVSIGPGSRHSFQVDLSPYFAFNHATSYRIAASIIMADGKTLYPSNRAGVNVNMGSEVRSFAIQSRGKRLHASVKRLRIEDQSFLFGQVLNKDTQQAVGACFLGHFLNFREPVVLLDSAQNLHCLFQSTPEYFTYSVMSPQGKRLSYQVMKRSGGPIDLVSTGKGIRVVGLGVASKPSKNPAPTGRKISERPY